MNGDARQGTRSVLRILAARRDPQERIRYEAEASGRGVDRSGGVEPEEAEGRGRPARHAKRVEQISRRGAAPGNSRSMRKNGCQSLDWQRGSVKKAYTKGILALIFGASAFPLLNALAALCLLLASCESIPPANSSIPEFQGAYFTGDGGKGLSLAVLLPRGRAPGGKELPESEQWLLSFVQGNLTADFSRYSAMEIIDRQTISQVLEEQNLSLSQNNSDKNTIIKIGNITNAQFLLTGTLEKMNAHDYSLQLSIVNAETAVLRASHVAAVSIAELRSLKPIREASIDLLKRMGVALTAEGEEAIRSVALQEAQGAIALAQGIAAGDENPVEKLIYLTNAVAFDSRQLEAIELLASTETDMSQMGTGAALQNDAEQQKQFLTMLNQFEEHYKNHPPFELVFVPKTVQAGETDYARHEAAVQFSVSLRESVEFDTMKKVLRIILDDLKKTGNKEKWGFKEWPGNAEIFTGKKQYRISAELLDDGGKILDTVQFTMEAQLIYLGGGIYANSSQNREVPFAKMNLDLYGNDPQVRISRINDKTARESLEEDYIRISSTLTLPPKRSRNILVLAWHNAIVPFFLAQ